MEHVDIAAGEIHQPHNWQWADAAARAAESGVNSGLVGRFGLQVDNGTLWRLASVAPTVWAELGYLPLAGGTITGAVALNGGVTLGDASGDALTINSSTASIPNGIGFAGGSVAVGSAPVVGRSLSIGKLLTGAATSFGVRHSAVIGADVTTAAIGFYSTFTTDTAAFALPTLTHFQAQQGALAGSGTITNQYGFTASSALTAGVNNYGFYGAIPAGTGRYNIYMAGTAANYLAGPLLLGSTSQYTIKFGSLSRNPVFQSSGIGTSDVMNAIFSFSNDTNAPAHFTAKSRGASLGTMTAVAAGDSLGAYSFNGVATDSLMHEAARIATLADGAPGSDFVAGQLVFYTAPSSAGSFVVARMHIGQTGVVTPGADNTQTFGTGALRWSVIYAGTGTINTSDAREKTSVAAMTANEIAAAKALAAEIGTFQFLDAIATKGEQVARRHVGMTVQRAIEIMQAHSLDPMRYGFICYDEWAATEAIEASDDSPGQPARPAGNRYGFRADELMLFLARGFEARLAALEGV